VDGELVDQTPVLFALARHALRVLAELQGAQVLSAFPVILPFQQGFGTIDLGENWV
jgi:hypothetical protein